MSAHCPGGERGHHVQGGSVQPTFLADRAQAPPQHAEGDTSYLPSSAFGAQKPGACLSYLKEGATGQCPSGLASPASCAETGLCS